MRRYLIVLAALLSLFSPAAQAANSTVSAMTAGTAVSDTDLLYCAQSAGTLDRKCTPLQLANYVFGKVSSDLTCTSTGGCSLKATGPGATGPLGSATVAPIVTIDAQGRVTALSSATIVVPISTGITGLATGIASWLATPSSANLAAALTDETGTGSAVFGTAPTISSLNATTAITLAFLTGSTQCLQVNTSGAVSGTGAACGGSGSTGANPTATASDTAVNGVATTFMRSDAAPAVQKASASQFGIVEVDGQTIVANGGVISFNAPINAQVGTSYTVLSTDKGKVITLTNASAVTVNIPVASTTGFGAPFYASFVNEGAGLVTLSPTTSTIDGAGSLTLAQNQSVDLVSDGTNYFTLRGRATASGTSTIASGTAALGTSAIASAACATVVTATATGTATTDVVTASFNGDPTAVTGYIPATTGMLTVIVYPTAGFANFKVCNNTSASITPGAITLNWRVVR